MVCASGELLRGTRIAVCTQCKQLSENHSIGHSEETFGLVKVVFEGAQCKSI